MPNMDAPTLDVPHVPRFDNPSSIVPSQSSSSPLQISVDGPVPPMHCTVPATQWFVPWTHVPVPLPQRAPPPGSPSSTMPLQSLSTLSQISARGTTTPLFTHTSLPV